MSRRRAVPFFAWGFRSSRLAGALHMFQEGRLGSEDHERIREAVEAFEELEAACGFIHEPWELTRFLGREKGEAAVEIVKLFYGEKSRELQKRFTSAKVVFLAILNQESVLESRLEDAKALCRRISSLCLCRVSSLQRRDCCDD